MENVDEQTLSHQATASESSTPEGRSICFHCPLLSGLGLIAFLHYQPIFQLCNILPEHGSFLLMPGKSSLQV